MTNSIYLRYTMLILSVSSIFVLVSLWIFYRSNRVIYTEVTLTKSAGVPPSFSVKQEFLFRLMNSSKMLIAVSAFWQPTSRNARVFLLKQQGSRPVIHCSFETAGGVTSGWTASHNCHGSPHQFQEWNEFAGSLRGFSICCTDPGDNALTFKDSEYTTLRLAVSNSRPSSDVPVVRLPIGKELPNISQPPDFPYKFAICIAPMFNFKVYSAKYLVEFLEMHRAIGAQLIIVYLSAKPTDDVKLILGNYEAMTRSDRGTKFKVIVVRWYLPGYVEPDSTWARAQIIAYNDCIYRFAHHAEYFVMSDLDEILVPAPELGYSWTNAVSALQTVAGENFAVACSCELRFWFQPLTGLAKESVFYADQTTRPECIFWRKCFIRSGLVRLFHVHEALEPRGFHHADKIFTVYHYRYCNTTCRPSAGHQVRANRHLWPLRRRLEATIRERLAQMSDSYSVT